MPPLNNVIADTDADFNIILARQVKQNSLDLQDHDERLRRELWLAAYDYHMKTSSSRGNAETEANRAVEAFDKKFKAA